MRVNPARIAARMAALRGAANDNDPQPPRWLWWVVLMLAVGLSPAVALLGRG